MTASSANEYQSPSTSNLNFTHMPINEEVNEDEAGTPAFTNDVSRNMYISPTSDIKLEKINKKTLSMGGGFGS